MPPTIPENAGSSPKSSMILRVGPWGETGRWPPPVFLLEIAHWLCSFFAWPTIPRHLSFTSETLRTQTPSEFTFWVIVSQTICFRLFVTVVENLLLMTSIFSSAASRITEHSAAVKFGFLFRLDADDVFSAILKQYANTGIRWLVASLLVLFFTRSDWLMVTKNRERCATKRNTKAEKLRTWSFTTK